MPADRIDIDERWIERALQEASDTRLLRIEHGARHQAALAIDRLFGQRPVIIVADVNTFSAAGRDVFDALRHAGHRCIEPFVFEQSELHADYEHVETLEKALAPHDATPVAVGSGTINDLTKLASHHLGRPYLVVATAASMDGYAAFGASITHHGSKQTFDCPAPMGILADLEVIESAPEGMNASGYADLLAKSVAGADWLVADALDVEPIDDTAWDMVQSRLRVWLADPAALQRGDPKAVRSLILGLVMSGFAMQRTKTSRPASGADHQFSHLWDMQHHVHQGKSPSHGFKVGIGTLASSALYEELLLQSLDELDVDRLCLQWPEFASVEADIRERFDLPDLAAKALEETRAKYIDRQCLRDQLMRIRTAWPQLHRRLRSHLIPYGELKDCLAAAGCPSAPHEIGISYERLRENYLQAYYIRRRFTVLDLAVRTALLSSALERIFGSQGRWPTAETGISHNL
ncbi:MAG: sn-glycerol-1-phosphate dehydrogenase [Pirellulales bacterium]|nr:sn-glycerol-1-phosphate dehydrogenase [Pirellulales bacterium]